MGFVCVPCHNNPKLYASNPHTMPMSHGPCEDCGVSAPCYNCKCAMVKPKQEIPVASVAPPTETKSEYVNPRTSETKSRLKPVLELFDGPDKFGILVEQYAAKHGRFRVTYGKQVKDNLTYHQACTEIGQCILHHLACESIVRNDGE